MAVDVFCLKKKKQKVLPSCLAIPIGRSVMVKGSRSARVRVRVCTSCKSLGQSGFYSLTWAHKVRFRGGEVSSNPKIIKKSLAMHGSKFIRDAKPIFSSVVILCTILCLFFYFKKVILTSARQNNLKIKKLKKIKKTWFQPHSQML